MSRECMFLGSLSRHNKDLEQRTLKPSVRTALGSWTNRATALRQISVTGPLYLEDSRRIQDSKRREWRSAWGERESERETERERTQTHGREKEREWERERKSARTQERESMRKCFGSSFYMFFPPPGPALCKLGLARSAVCSAWSLHSGPRTFLWRSLSFSHGHFELLFPILPT